MLDHLCSCSQSRHSPLAASRGSAGSVYLPSRLRRPLASCTQPLDIWSISGYHVQPSEGRVCDYVLVYLYITLPEYLGVSRRRTGLCKWLFVWYHLPRRDDLANICAISKQFYFGLRSILPNIYISSKYVFASRIRRHIGAQTSGDASEIVFTRVPAAPPAIVLNVEQDRIIARKIRFNILQKK